MSQVAGPNSPVSPQLQRMGAAAAEEIRGEVRGALSELFEGYLEHLRSSLTQGAQAARTPADQGNLQYMARKLSGATGSWVNTFLKRVDDQLIGNQSSNSEESARSTADAPESVAIANMELRAEAQYRKPVMELDARLNRVRLTLYVPINTRALAPAGLYSSLSETADAMGWPSAQRYLLFKRFDEIIVPALDGFYSSLLQTLKSIGQAAAKLASLNQDTAEVAVAPTLAKHANPAEAVAAGKVDAETSSMLKAYALGADGEGYTDGLLAADLLALMDERPLPGITREQGQVPLQRVSMAGHYLNGVIDDPLIPQDLRSDHESMRLPLVKSALTDPTLFTEVTHPLRSLVHDLMLKSATSRLSENGEARRLADLLQQVMVNFNLAPDFVRLAMATAKPIEATQIQRFFDLQRQQAEQRKSFVINEAKRLVIKEMERVTFGLGIPPPAIQFLNKAWGPVLTRRLLNHGAAHEQWKSAIKLMQDIMDELELRQPGEAVPAEWQALMRSVGRTLMAEGMGADLIKEALANLEAARTTAL